MILNRQQKYYERKKTLGFKIRTFLITNEEWLLIKEFLKKLRS